MHGVLIESDLYLSPILAGLGLGLGLKDEVHRLGLPPAVFIQVHCLVAISILLLTALGLGITADRSFNQSDEDLQSEIDMGLFS